MDTRITMLPSLTEDHSLSVLWIVLLAIVLYNLTIALYNVHFHPLKNIPGPKLAAASRLVWAKHIRDGNIVKYITKLHQKYGEVVRLAPNELSFISGETAWQDIYGLRIGKRNKGAYLKDPMFFPLPPNGVNSIIAATEEDHARQRRLVSHAFSERALREQEQIIQRYVNLLIQRMHQQVEGKARGRVDMVRWYNYTTFDVIADLTFGESFHCLQNNDYHPWVSMAFQVMKSFGIISLKRYFPLWAWITGLFQTPTALKLRKKFFTFVDEKVASRLSTETTRPDFMSFILRHQDEKGMSVKEMESSLNSFMIAGSETSATTLSGLTWFLTQHPDKLLKLAEEVRGRFKAQEDITIKEVMQMPYLVAVINETLRLYPPVPTGFPRVVPKGGDFISGHWVPEKTSVYVTQYAANHSSRNFTEPSSFIPERWLGDPRFSGDNFAVFNPFSYGPRNCIGKNLAAAEMRLVVAKMIWNFDLELHPDTKNDWIKQKVFALWEKPPLFVQLKPRRIS
ncbi:isotrichodermin C-15 hydroxylase [Nannizzia gypsea CBS 118893]|uniref:Isotrichodermin C-15 hydroxylase n=1 Tax=Arthroderma gypseum (strain ATCC MYA-4604 / CBS 118893) TaxID=535722 RepID=E4UPM9_ARTGP|nr:isotrichodermin C-15 hydroxylase [Nannizzia gypsea CBS 118893]EFQ99066.1 isotrichodermin C-15 hydroxylase [Nannizzia gypsea CBS 118893]